MQIKSVMPVSTGERIEILDLLRGFALLGILLANMSMFSFPVIAQLTGSPRGDALLDRAAGVVIAWLATGKFYPLFSFLFGLGMGMQMVRLQERGGNIVNFMVRRLVILTLFGLAHALLIWNVDILFIYGLIGLLIVPFRNARPKTLLVCAIVACAIPIVLGVAASAAAMAFSGPEITSDRAEFDALMVSLERRALETYRDGTLAQIFVWRAMEWPVIVFFNLFAAGLQIVAIFLVGLYSGKRGIFRNIPQHLPLFSRGLRFGIGFGLPINFIIALMSRDIESPLAGIGATLLLAFGPVLTFGYISAFVIVAQSRVWLDRLAPLAAAGRMALSNYLLQSVVCTLIFYSYGFGLYGQVGAAPGFVLSFTIWLIQLPLSVLWLREFRFGPMEWLWRTLTYGKAQPMMKSVAAMPVEVR
jgi:uncharacterized protein